MDVIERMRVALVRADYCLDERQASGGWCVTGLRNSDTYPYFAVFGRTCEEAYRKACASVRVVASER